MQHTVHREPLAAVLALRQLYTFPQAVSAQSCIGELLQLPCCRALSAFLALECLSVAGIGVAARQKVSLCRYMRKSVAQASVRLLLSRFRPPDWRWMRRAQTAVGGVVGGEERMYLLLQRTLVDGVWAAGQWQVEVRFRLHEHIALDGGQRPGRVRVLRGRGLNEHGLYEGGHCGLSRWVCYLEW
jgi:hypothetical protein